MFHGVRLGFINGSNTSVRIVYQNPYHTYKHLYINQYSIHQSIFVYDNGHSVPILDKTVYLLKERISTYEVAFSAEHINNVRYLI